MGKGTGPKKPSSLSGGRGAKREAGRWIGRAAFGLLALLALLSFANAFPNSFALDDVPIIVENRLIKSLGHLPTLFTTDYWAGTAGSGVGGALYRPLVLVSFALNYFMGGLNPFGYHLVNLLLHLAASWVLYALARQLDLSWAGALAASALFAVHPLHTEAVTGIVGRAELLMALGVLLAVVWYRRGGAPDRLEPGFAVASWGAFALALLSKEQAMMLPALLLLSDFDTARDVRRRTWKEVLPGAWRRYLGYLLILGAFLVLRAAVLGSFVPQAHGMIHFLDNPLAHVPRLPQVVTALKVAGRYLWLFMWPAKLSADYSYTAIPIATSPWEPGVLLAGLAWGGLLGLGAYAYQRGVRPLFFGIGCTVLTFLPVSNLLIPIGTIMGERLFYLPSAGLCLIVGAGWDGMAAWAAQAGCLRLVIRVGLGVFALVLLLLSARTILRNQDWRNTRTLSQSTVQVVPHSAKAQVNYGAFLLDVGRIDEAIDALKRALTIEPDYADAHRNLGRAYAEKGLWHEAEAAAQRALAIWEKDQGQEHPAVAEALNDLGEFCYYQGKYGEAEPLYQRALAIRERALGPEHPAVAHALNNLAVLYYAQRKYAEAEPLFRRALAIREKALGADHPAMARLLENYADLLRQTNRTAEALMLEARAQAIRSKDAQSNPTK